MGDKYESLKLKLHKMQLFSYQKSSLNEKVISKFIDMESIIISNCIEQFLDLLNHI